MDAAKRTVLVTWPGFDQDGLAGRLREQGLDLRFEPKTGNRTPADLIRIAAGVEAAIVSTDPFDADVLGATPSLKVIARVGFGVDSIDLEAATRENVAVVVAPGVSEAVVAEHTVALMLALVRCLPERDAEIRRGDWRRTGTDTPLSLRGSTVGLVGYGRIGGLLVARLRGFELRLLVCDPALGATSPGVEVVALDDLLRASDVVSLHVPLLPSTRKLIGGRELALMRPDAILINTARGGIVDEQALVEALASGRLRAAGLDVFEKEPPTDRRLLDLPNVLLSPHNAALSERSIAEMTAMATTAVLDVLAQRFPAHLVNPEVADPLGLKGDRSVEFHDARGRS
ncbi:MAG: phosphoglycerate dehydrogenase [Actinobacteria bacterium]|nr:phosphoglycerate dehydrogenase [Actinomycetota bacterium]